MRQATRRPPRETLGKVRSRAHRTVQDTATAVANITGALTHPRQGRVDRDALVIRIALTAIVAELLFDADLRVDTTELPGCVRELGGTMLTVYGIPNCDTVRRARRWLDDHDAPHTFVDYRKTPPSAETVAGWVQTLGARALKNTSGGAYRALPNEKKSWDDARWAAEFAANPMLIKRPVIERDGTAIQVGFRNPDPDTLLNP